MPPISSNLEVSGSNLSIDLTKISASWLKQIVTINLTVRCTYKAKYFPSRLMDITEAGFLSNLLYPILFQLLMSQTAVTAFSPVSKNGTRHSIGSFELDTYLVLRKIIPFWTVQNKNGLVPSLENRQSSIFSSWTIQINMLLITRKCNKHTVAGTNIYHTALLVRVVTGTPSSDFQTLADPSFEVEAKNSESRLEQD